MRKTKAQIVAEQEAEKRARISEALHWSKDGDILPDVPPPTFQDGFGALTTGWTFNIYTRSILPACSSSSSHAIGRTEQPTRTNSQRPISLFSTRERALRALRVALEREFAEELAKVDELIGKELEAK